MTTHNDSGSSGWAAARDVADRRRRDDSVFLNPGPEETKRLVIIGDPHTEIVHWTDRGPEACTGPSSCVNCAAGRRRSILFNVYVYDNDLYRPRVLTGAVLVQRVLTDLHDRVGGLDGQLVELQRHGSDKETRFEATVVGEISPELREVIAGLRLPPLEDVVNRRAADLGDLAPHAEPPDSPPPRTVSTAPRIPEEGASELATGLGKLSVQARDAFCRRFGVVSIRDIRAADERAAADLLAEMSAAASSESSPTGNYSFE